MPQAHTLHKIYPTKLAANLYKKNTIYSFVSFYRSLRTQHAYTYIYHLNINIIYHFITIFEAHSYTHTTQQSFLHSLPPYKCLCTQRTRQLSEQMFVNLLCGLQVQKNILNILEYTDLPAPALGNLHILMIYDI